jgi:hypothetical protein
MSNQRSALVVAAALAALTVSCAPHARVGVYADVPGPPSLAFETEPYLVPLPGTYVYAAPDYDVDLYYADGYYWRPWEGRWYRSSRYDRGWAAYSGVPGFYTSLPRNWRNDYQSHRWRGRSWEYSRVPHHEVERNWSNWKRARRWDDDQRRYSGDRRWLDDGRRVDRRDSDVRRGDRPVSQQSDYDRRETDRREQSRPEYDRREPDRRVYESREVDRREYEERRQPVESREIQRREVERRQPVESREIQRRETEKREAAPVTREMEPRPVVHERPQQVERDSRPRESRDVTPRGRGQVRKDENRDGIDDSLQQRPR